MWWERPPCLASSTTAKQGSRWKKRVKHVQCNGSGRRRFEKGLLWMQYGLGLPCVRWLLQLFLLVGAGVKNMGGWVSKSCGVFALFQGRFAVL